MSALLRGVTVVLSVGLVWAAAADRVAMSARLPAGAVVRGATVTQPFGCTTVALEPFDPYCPSRHFHSGVDLAAPAGTPVYAATAGRAVSGYDGSGCGLFVSVEDGDHVRVLYCHLHWAAFASATVTTGELIGQVGSSGLATGPHLHLEVQVGGRAVDPIRWLASS